MGSRNRGLKQRTLDHYGRMKRWAKKRKSDGVVSYEEMFIAIGEDWRRDCCPYCLEQASMNLNCESCQLRGIHACDCCEGAWFDMHTSKTWSDWLRECDRVIDYIKENG